MKEIITSIFGEYVPVITSENILVGDVVESYDVVASGLAGVDFCWIAGVLLFAILLFGFCRVLGVLIKNG